MPKPPQTPIGLLLAHTAKAVSRAFDEALSDAGGSLPVWLILLALKARPTSNQRELAAAVGIQGATLTHHLNALEAHGLVTRRRDPANRRVHIVELTGDGTELFKRLAAAAGAFDSVLRERIDDGDLERLRRTLGQLEANANGSASVPPARRNG